MSESQKTIQHPNKELQEYLQDIYNWENEIKKKDAELRRRYLEQAEEQLIRVQRKTTESLNIASGKEKLQSKVEKVRKNSEKTRNFEGPSNSQRTTRDIDYSSWDKFDVEKALREVGLDVKDEQSDNSSENSEDEEMEVEQKKQRAILEKDKGNRFFKQGKYDEAIACYTTGINLDPMNAMLPANRALALLRKGHYSAAEKDCSAAINWDPSYVKAYHRRGIVRVKMKLYELAREDFIKALKLDPNNKESKQELDNLEKIVDKQKKKASANSNVAQEMKKESSVDKKDLVVVKDAIKPKKSELHKHNLSEVPEKLVDGDNIPSKDWDNWKAGSVPKASNLVVPIIKPLHLRSKKPLRRIEVQEVDSSVNQGISTRSADLFSSTSVPSSRQQNIDAFIPDKRQPTVSSIQVPSHPLSKDMQNSVAPKVPGIPQTSYQFMVDWRTLRHYPELQFDYLMQIPPDLIPHIFSQYMETEILSTILDVVSKYFSLKHCDPYPYLLEVTKVGRFSTLCMFMSLTDKTNLKSIVDGLKQSGNYSEEQLQELLRKFLLDF